MNRYARTISSTRCFLTYGMRVPRLRAHVRIAVLSALGCVCTSAFAGDAPAPQAATTDGKAVICHQTESEARIIEVSTAAVPAHTAHGDHIAQFVVDPQADAIGDGIHFARIGDALAAARAVRIARGELHEAACRITIVVAPGVFRGSLDASADPALEQFPLIVDVPQITLHGGLRMIVDADNRATGASEDEAEVTTLAPDRPLADVPLPEGMIVVVGHPDGSRGDGTVIEGFAFQSGHVLVDLLAGGTGVFSLRVVDLVVRDNRFEPQLTTALDLRATSARIERNHARRLGVNCSLCLSGPGDYEVADNRLLEGGLGGMYLVTVIGDLPFSLGTHPATLVEPYVLPAAAAMTASVANNDIRDHVHQPIGFAIRIPSVGPGASNVPQSSRVSLRDNDFVHNTFALVVDGGFTVASALIGVDLDLSLKGNGFAGSCQNDLLVAFTRHTGALGITTNPYLHNSTYRLDLGGDLNWNDAWYNHPPGFGNTLVVDGVVVPTGSHVPYDRTRPCTL